MNGNPVTESEVADIHRMMVDGKTNKEIAAAMNRSIRTVQRVTSKYDRAKKKADWEAMCFLVRWWNWEKPKKKPKKDEYAHSWFITPYNYPRMWKVKEE